MSVRRDKNDLQWQKLKEEVRTRDKGDRILRVLTVKEALLLQRKAPRVQLEKLDAAHIFPVSIYPDLVYDKNNVVLINRYSHENLDNLRHPVTGDVITYEERQGWWARLAGKQWQKLLNRLDS
jgi:hypothetical protein